jgi:cardiolipin synthase (CMP-forming)
MQMPRWFNLANFFTLLRLILVPFVVLDILSGRHTAALVLFGAAAVTDVLDGALARGYGLGTQAGAYLDPIADKCLLSGIFLALGASGMVPWWFVAIVFGRDLYILLAVVAVLGFTKVRKFPPSQLGKASTFVQILTAVVWMTRNIFEVRALVSLSAAMLWVCAAFAIGSGVHYTFRGIQVLRAH